ncbi:hypothetical protein D3C76_1485750 [compost metagenome]
MIHVITSIVEWAIVLFILGLAFWPFLSYMWKYGTKGVFFENGVGYLEILIQTARTRFVELAATMALVFFLAAIFPKVACAMAIWFFMVAISAHIAIKAGHKPGLTMS